MSKKSSTGWITKVEVKGKTKIYHTNLLKHYFERYEDIAGVAVQVDSHMAGVAVLHEEPEDGENLDSANLLELQP